MAYFPLAEVRAWPPDALGGAGTAIGVVNGRISLRDNEASAEFTFDLPEDYDFTPDDYSATQLLRRGARIQVTTTEDGDLAGAGAVVKFEGFLVTYDVSRDGDMTRRNFVCRDKMASSRSVGIRMSRATKMLIYDDTFAAGDFVDDFIVNLPDATPAAPNEFVPQGMVYLAAYLPVAGDNDTDNYEYPVDEYVYDAANQQIAFKFSQAVFKGAGRTWTFRLYYYDPADVSNTVNAILEEILEGDPWSIDGGLGFDPADHDLKDIKGFDAAGLTSDAYGYWYAVGTTKKFRTVVSDKTDGPALDLLDEFRDAGMLPRDYRIWLNPIDRKVLGRYMIQDAAAVITLNRVIDDNTPFTLEGMAGRVETHSQAITPVNYALGKDATVTIPAGYSARSHTAPVGLVYPDVTDGKAKTALQIYKASLSLSTPPTATGANCIVIDLGQEEWIERLQFRGTHPMELSGTDWIDIPVYFISRLPKVTLSGSCDAITATNPGIPVSPEAIAVEIDPTNVGVHEGMDIDVECTAIKKMRYIAIRWDQDFFYRRDGNRIGSTARESWFGVSELKALGDGKFRYEDGDDIGDVPHAQLTDVADTVANFTNGGAGGADITFTADPSSWLTAGEQFQVLHAGVPLTYTSVGPLPGGAPWVVNVAEAIIAGDVAINDDIGWRKRWMLDLSSTWRDLYYPKLYDKIVNSLNWLEIIDDDRPDTIVEAEAMAVNRLLELLFVGEYHETTIGLDHDVDIGKTVRTSATGTKWMVNEIDYLLSKPRDRKPVMGVKMRLKGKNYEETPQ